MVSCMSSEYDMNHNHRRLLHINSNRTPILPSQNWRNGCSSVTCLNPAARYMLLAPATEYMPGTMQTSGRMPLMMAAGRGVGGGGGVKADDSHGSHIWPALCQWTLSEIILTSKVFFLHAGMGAFIPEEGLRSVTKMGY